AYLVLARPAGGLPLGRERRVEDERTDGRVRVERPVDDEKGRGLRDRERRAIGLHERRHAVELDGRAAVETGLVEDGGLPGAGRQIAPTAALVVPRGRRGAAGGGLRIRPAPAPVHVPGEAVSAAACAAFPGIAGAAVFVAPAAPR